MTPELQSLFNDVSKLAPGQKGPYETYLVVSLIRDVAYYIIMAIVAWALGRRIVHAILTAYRETRRERA
jgi:mannosyltransferase OCH1-like enzyme